VFEKYPNDTLFNGFHVSYRQDLSELNTAGKFFYSNHTTSFPVLPDSLKEIAGCGNSPVIRYEGLGAYFLDRLETGIWRLEVMPDAVPLRDPFEKTSLKKEVVAILWNTWNMKITLSDLGPDFRVTALNMGNSHRTQSSDAAFSIQPGVYLLERAGRVSQRAWDKSTRWKNSSLGEFAAPESRVKTFAVVHQAANVIEQDKPLLVEAQIVGPSFPDSVLLFTDKVSFWFENNPFLKMKRIHGYTYQTEIPGGMIKESTLKYNIVVFKDEKKYTFPANVEGSPLDWDYYQTNYWEIPVRDAGSPIELLKITDEYSGLESHGIPEWIPVKRNLNTKNPLEPNRIDFHFSLKTPRSALVWRKYIKEQVQTRPEALQKARYLCLNLKNAKGIERMKAGFITSDGFTYTCEFEPDNGTEPIRIPLSKLHQDKTFLLPSPYPVFLEKQFVPDVQIPFQTEAVEILEITAWGDLSEDAGISLGNVWLE
jgi:hypothetical protein